MSKSVPVIRFALMGAILAGAAGLFVLTRDHLALDREGTAFVKDAVAAIGAHWDAAELWQRATPHFREQTKADDVRAAFDAANNSLGPLVEYRAVGGKTPFLFVPSDRPVAAEYIVRATFAKGEADIEIHAIRTGSTWRIDSFDIGASPEMRKLLGMQG